MDGRPSRGLLQNRKKIFKAIERRICRLSGGLPNTKKKTLKSEIKDLQ